MTDGQTDAQAASKEIEREINRRKGKLQRDGNNTYAQTNALTLR